MRTPFILALGLTLFASLAQAETKNIILMIGDGMGHTHLTAYRHMQHSGGTAAIAPTIFDQLLVGTSSTHPEGNTIVTDSASSATALATGHKTCNGAVSVDCDGKPLGTLFQAAKKRGMLTGVVSTSHVNHATPAAFFAHHPSRQAYNAIADQYLDTRVNEKLPVDVIIGGGTSYFLRADRNLVEELKAQGYQYADSWKDLDKLSAAPALGLLAEAGLPSALDNPEPRPLARMTDRALSLLKDAEKGFVVMIEGSQIDWCGHANDIACAMGEMHDFAEAAAVAKTFVDANPDTLLLITADHETGGLSLGADGHYQWRADAIRSIRHTAPALSQKLIAADKWEPTWKALTGLALSGKEKTALANARDAGGATLTGAIKNLIDSRSHTGWTTGGHTAADVPLMVYGAGGEYFRGLVDNAEIGRRLIKMVD